MTTQAVLQAPLAAKPSRKISLSMSQAHSHGPLSYLQMGNMMGPTIVFIHGFGADLLTWQFCLVPLSSRYRVIALDLPGHGRSAPEVGAADMAYMTGWRDEALDVLQVREAHLVGHSMGAKIALGYVLGHPERVQSLSLIAPAGLGGEFHHDTLDAFLHANTYGAAETLAWQLLGPRGQNLVPSLMKSLVAAAADPAKKRALEALLGQAKAYGLALSPEGFDWSAVTCPVEILWGDCDRLIPMPEDQRLPPNAPVRTISGVGHLPHMESPAAVVAYLKEFLP